MKKILFLLLLILFAFNVNAQETQTLGSDLIIDSLTMNPFPVEPGSYFDITLIVRNSNTRRTINDLRFNLQDSYPFTVGGEKIKRVASLRPSEQATIIFRIKTDNNAVSGTHELTIEYQEEAGTTYLSKPIKIDVRANAIDLSVVSVKTIPEIIKPGDEVEIILTLKNTVPVLMKNIDINLDVSAIDNPFTPIKTTTKRSLSSLNKGLSKELSFYLAVDAKAEPKVYKVPLKIEYEDEFGNDYTVDTLTGLKVLTDPYLSYSIDTSEVFKSGDSGKISVKIVNTGLADVKFLSIKLLESDDYDIISVPNVYIGNLESDDYENADFTLYAKSKKELPLKLEVNYKDPFNVDYKKVENIALPLYSRYELSKFGVNGAGNEGSFVYYAILVVFAYLFIKEFRKVKDVGMAFKLSIRHLLVFLKRIIKSFKPSNLRKIIKDVINFLKEE